MANNHVYYIFEAGVVHNNYGYVKYQEEIWSESMAYVYILTIYVTH